MTRLVQLYPGSYEKYAALRRCNHRIITTKALRKEILAGERASPSQAAESTKNTRPTKL